MRKCKSAVVKRGQAQSRRKVPCEVYSRSVGYLRPTSWWNKGKRQEFEERQTYNLKGSLERFEKGQLRREHDESQVDCDNPLS